jgi:hypothetical protein
MRQVLKEKARLFVKSLSNAGGDLLEGGESSVRVFELHRAALAFRFATRSFLMFASIEAAISSAVLNGPYTRPALTSLSALARRASMMRRCPGVYSSSAFGSLVVFAITLAMV